MAILYRIPSIGTKANNYAQKGPTCWYYAAKMLLKFHHKLEKHEDNLVYDQFKQLHELRSILTQLGEDYEGLAKSRMRQLYHGMRVWSREEITAEIEKRKASLGGMGLDQEAIRQMTEASEASLNQALHRTPDPVKVERLRKAVEILDEKIGDSLDRLELLTNFVSGAGFIKVESKLGNEDDVEKILRTYGPVFAGGRLALTTRRVKVTEALRNSDGEGKGLPSSVLEFVYELDPKSAHVLVISGIKGKSVFCVDPNASNKQVEVDFAALSAHVDSIIAIQCNGCAHLGWYACAISD